MSFTDQKPFLVTEEHVRAPWGGTRAQKGATTHPRFRCSWCGHKFTVGDTARWVLTNTSEPATKGLSGNPFICDKCDGPRDVILAKLRAVLEEFNAPRFWWFRHDERERGYSEGASDEAREQARLQREDS